MWAGHWDIRRFDELDSTNTYLKDQARLGAEDGTVAVAGHQTAGRGRLDRRWEAPPGAALLASVLLRPVIDPADLHLCTAAVALAAAQACREMTGVEVLVKWPNDLVVGGAKLAGVLAEAELGSDGVRSVVVGIGINLGWPGPPGVGGTCLDEARTDGLTTDPDALLQGLLASLAPRRQALDAPDGRRGLADELRSSCSTLGQRVRVELAGQTLTGVATELDDAGHLVVLTADGQVTVAAGDVIHLRPS